MANYKKTSTSFVPGDPRAIAYRKMSSANQLPKDLKELRKQKAKTLELFIYKYADISIDEMKEKLKDNSLSYLEHIIMAAMVKAKETGDFMRIEPMLNRAIGKVKDEIEHTVHRPSILVKRDGTELHFLNEPVNSPDEEEG